MEAQSKWRQLSSSRREVQAEMLARPMDQAQRVRSTYFPDADDDDSSSIMSAYKAKPMAGTAAGEPATGCAHDSTASCTATSAMSGLQTKPPCGDNLPRAPLVCRGGMLAELDRFYYRVPTRLGIAWRGGGGEGASTESGCERGGDEGARSLVGVTGASGGNSTDPEESTGAQAGGSTQSYKPSIYFGDVRFPASRSILWPRQPSGPAAFVSSHEVAPLLLLRVPSLRALHAQLLSSHTHASSSGDGESRGGLLAVRAATTDVAEGVPPTLIRSLLHPPPLALTLDGTEAALQLCDGEDVSQLTIGLLSEATSSSTSNPPSAQRDPWLARIPVIDTTHRHAAADAHEGSDGEQVASEEIWRSMSEADYAALMAWTTSQLEHPQKTALPLQAALGTMRILASATSRDTLSLRAERIVPALTLRFTPLEPLAALHTSLWARLLGRPHRPTETGPQTGYLTLNETRRVVALLSSDPLALQRPLVGVWVAGVGKSWASGPVAAMRDPFLMAAILRFAVGDAIPDRVTVEPHSLLLAWFGPSEGTPPLFFEVHLLWSNLPSASSAPDQPPSRIQYQLLDFTVDVTLDDADAGLGSGGELWLSTIAGHFRETVCPHAAQAFYRAQRRSHSPASSPLEPPPTRCEADQISALTLESRLLPPQSPKLAPSSSPSPILRRPQVLTPQRVGVTSSASPVRRPCPPGRERSGGVDAGSVALHVHQGQHQHGLEHEQHQQQDGHPHGAMAPPQAWSTATQQLVLAQQQHLNVLQRQVQELQSRLTAALAQSRPTTASIGVQTEPYPPTSQLLHTHARACRSSSADVCVGAAKQRESEASVRTPLLRQAGVSSSDGEVAENDITSQPQQKGGPSKTMLHYEGQTESASLPPSASRAGAAEEKMTASHGVCDDADEERKGLVLDEDEYEAATFGGESMLLRAPSDASIHQPSTGGAAEAKGQQSCDSASAADHHESTVKEVGSTGSQVPVIEAENEEGLVVTADDCLRTGNVLGVDIPRIVYDLSESDEDDDEGQTMIEIEARYLRMMDAKHSSDTSQLECSHTRLR